MEGVFHLSIGSMGLGSPVSPFLAVFHPFLETILLSVGNGAYFCAGG